MKSVEARYRLFDKASQGHSSFIVFSRAITGQGFTKAALGKWFNRLVNRGDYSKGDKRRILKHLWALNVLVERGKQGQNASKTHESPYYTLRHA